MPSAYIEHPAAPAHNILEAGRLETFDERWNHPDESICSRFKMAKAGFSYTGVDDCVKCFVCRIKLSGWEANEDEPWQKHIEASPNCLFAKLGKEESQLTVDQWLDIMCHRALNALDSKMNQIKM